MLEPRIAVLQLREVDFEADPSSPVAYARDFMRTIQAAGAAEFELLSRENPNPSINRVVPPARSASTALQEAAAACPFPDVIVIDGPDDAAALAASGTVAESTLAVLLRVRSGSGIGATQAVRSRLATLRFEVAACVSSDGVTLPGDDESRIRESGGSVAFLRSSVPAAPATPQDDRAYLRRCKQAFLRLLFRQANGAVALAREAGAQSASDALRAELAHRAYWRLIMQIAYAAAQTGGLLEELWL